ncbi:MAG TPA: hypothetical protein VMU16_01715, partial [Candidatus Binataceae bacterium]|nr:hypothetical protein [Candidatus Binataceae bacterium]
MNKVFCSIFAVSALMVSTAATAHSAPMSGNYAIEMRGYTPDQMPASATGLAPFPAPEAAIGVLNLNKSGTVTGELIYSTGTSVTAPTTCGDTGAPCFNGSSSTITGGTFTVGANGLGTLAFTDTNSGRSFIFAVVVDAKGREFRGTSTPAVADEATAPILAIVGEKQGHIRAS